MIFEWRNNPILVIEFLEDKMWENCWNFKWNRYNKEYDTNWFDDCTGYIEYYRSLITHLVIKVCSDIQTAIPFKYLCLTNNRYLNRDLPIAYPTYQKSIWISINFRSTFTTNMIKIMGWCIQLKLQSINWILSISAHIFFKIFHFSVSLRYLSFNMKEYQKLAIETAMKLFVLCRIWTIYSSFFETLVWRCASNVLRRWMTSCATFNKNGCEILETLS